MINTNTGGPAFPIIHPPVDGLTAGGVEFYGMTLRDYFAAKAMQGIVSTIPHLSCVDPNVAAAEAYEFADAMLKARVA